MVLSDHALCKSFLRKSGRDDWFAHSLLRRRRSDRPQSSRWDKARRLVPSGLRQPHHASDRRDTRRKCERSTPDRDPCSEHSPCASLHRNCRNAFVTRGVGPSRRGEGRSQPTLSEASTALALWVKRSSVRQRLPRLGRVLLSSAAAAAPKIQRTRRAPQSSGCASRF